MVFNDGFTNLHSPNAALEAINKFHLDMRLGREPKTAPFLTHIIHRFQI